MISEFETYILGILQALFDSWGWFGVTGLMAFENATGITPSEVILGLAGWFLLSTHNQPFGMVFIGGLYAAVGSTLGASLTYWVSRLGGRPLINRIIRWVRIDPIHLERVEQLFQRRGASIVLFGRVIPGIRTLVSIPAGLAGMPFGRFVVSTMVGAYVWCTFLITLGFFFGNEWERFSALFKQYAYVAAGLVMVVLIAWFAGKKWMQRKAIKISFREEIDEY